MKFFRNILRRSRKSRKLDTPPPTSIAPQNYRDGISTFKLPDIFEVARTSPNMKPFDEFPAPTQEDRPSVQEKTEEDHDDDDDISNNHLYRRDSPYPLHEDFSMVSHAPLLEWEMQHEATKEHYEDRFQDAEFDVESDMDEENDVSIVAEIELFEEKASSFSSFNYQGFRMSIESVISDGSVSL